MELLNEASLSGTESSAQWPLEDEGSDYGKSVLKTFNDLHRSWMTNIEFPELNAGFNTEDLLENGEAGLYYTRSLFADGVGYDAVLKGDDVLGGIRVTDFQERNNEDHTGHLGYYLNPIRGEFFNNKDYHRATYGITGYSFGRDILNPNGAPSTFNSLNRWRAYDAQNDHESRSFITSNPPIVETGILVGVKNRSKQYEGTQLRNYCGMFSSTIADWYENGYGGMELPLYSRLKTDNRGEDVISDREKMTAIEPGKGFNVKIGESTPTDLFKSSGGVRWAHTLLFYKIWIQAFQQSIITEL